MNLTMIKEADKDQLLGILPEEYLYGAENTCICAIDNSEVNGVLSAALDEGRSMEIRYIFIDPEYRGQRIATSLISMLADLSRTIGVSSLSTSFIRQGAKDEYALFLQKLGFELIEDSGIFSIDLSLADMSLENENTSGCTVSPINKVTRSEWNTLNNILQEKRLNSNRSGTSDIYIIPGDREKYDMDLSHMAFDNTGKILGTIFVRKTSDGLIIDYLCNFYIARPQISIALMKAACDAAAEKYPEIKIFFHAYNPLSEKMARKHFGRFIKDEGRAEFYLKYI